MVLLLPGNTPLAPELLLSSKVDRVETIGVICIVVAIVQEICYSLNKIVLGDTKLPHPIIIPPAVEQTLYVSGEMIFPKVDDRVKFIDSMLTR